MYVYLLASMMAICNNVTSVKGLTKDVTCILVRPVLAALDFLRYGNVPRVPKQATVAILYIYVPNPRTAIPLPQTTIGE